MKRNVRLLAISFSLLFFSSCEKVFAPEPANNPEAIFENLWNTFNEEYAVFNFRRVDWDHLYTVYRPQVSARTTPDELYTILCNMLAELDDGHVTLTMPGKEMFISNHIMRNHIDDELFDRGMIRNNYLSEVRSDAEASYFYGGIRGEDVAYIYLDHVGENFFKLKEWIAAYPAAKGYIIDLRHNQGGDFTYCLSEMGPFTNESRGVFASRTKTGKGREDFSDLHLWYIYPSGNYIDKPVVVLTDRYTISAAERSVMAFMELPNVTLMGDTTSGAHGTMIGRELANGWFYSLVPQRVWTTEGPLEGKGIAPDIVFKNDPAQVRSGRDQLLEKAVAHLK